MDDLYLDIVVLPTGEVVQKDADELEEALINREINNRQYRLACEEAAKVIADIKGGSFRLLNLSESHKQLLVGLPVQKGEK
ncbi:hypothetical protein [Brevibacillus sp. 179-C9.3 HS]|uniref:hypothetical protein n=1 Tax=unclassified Brevibacillus TaxID=2684853 RepID=UPI0039A03EBA